MPSPYVMRRMLLDAEERVSKCGLHYRLSKEVRDTSLFVLEQPDEINYPLLRNRLISLSAKLSPICQSCSPAIAILFNLETEITAKIRSTPEPGTSTIELPDEDSLYSRITSTYPFPIARSYKQISTPDDDRRQIDRVINAFDFSLRYCTYLLLASASIERREERLRDTLKEAWKKMDSPSFWEMEKTVKEIGEHFEFPDSFFHLLFAKLQEGYNDIQGSRHARNKEKHATGYFPDSSLEIKTLLDRFLHRNLSLSEVKLVYVRNPLNFSERKKRMKYDVIECTGYSFDFTPSKESFPKESLLENGRVCLFREEDEANQTPYMCIPLYPLFVTFHARPVDQIYMYHSYDRQRHCFEFVHPLFPPAIVTAESDEPLFSDLDRKINQGLPTDE